MKYVIDPNAEEPIMLIDTHIGTDKEDGPGILGSEFVRELLYLDTLGKKKIHIWINSIGGNVLEGMQIYSAMLKTNAKVYTHNCGVAASISAVLFEGGYKKKAADYSLLMFHDAFDPAGNSGGEELKRINDSIAIMVSERTGKTVDEIKAVMGRTTWMSAEEALAFGFCDEVEVSSGLNRPKMSTSDVKDSWKAAGETLKNIVNKVSTNTHSMKNLANFLKLNESASEGAILEEVTKLKNSASASEAKVAEMEKECKNAKDALAKKEEELKGMKDDFEKKEKEAKDAKDAADLVDAQNKAKELVDAAVRTGVIKNDADEIKDWTARAIKDIVDTKKILDKLSGNKDGVDLTKSAKNAGDEGKKFGSVIAVQMAENREKLKI